MHAILDIAPAQRLLSRVRRRLPDLRRQLVEHLARHALHRTIAHNPVDTGRSRAAWIKPLEQLGGPVPPGWQGPHPSPAAIHEGIQAAQLERRHDNHTTTIRISNAVPYITYLEYGTHRTAPRAMTRRAIHETRQQLIQLAQQLLNQL